MIKLLTLFLLSFSLNLEAQEFVKESDKLDWVAKTFKDQRMFGLWYRDGYEELGKQIMYDFINQNNIEAIEPIAKGSDIGDPSIAKFNQACPKEKPINIVKSVVNSNNPNTIHFLDCLRDMKIFKINLDSGSKIEDAYLLYCADYACKDDCEWVVHKKQHDNDSYNSVYLGFIPNQCDYSKELFYVPPLTDISGIFKYHNKIYFYWIYSVGTFHDVEEDIFVEKQVIQLFTSVNGEIKSITSADFIDKQYHPFSDEVLRKKDADAWQRILDVQEKIMNENKQVETK